EDDHIVSVGVDRADPGWAEGFPGREASREGREYLLDELLRVLVLPGRGGAALDPPAHVWSEHVGDRPRALLPCREGLSDHSPVAFGLAVECVSHCSCALFQAPTRPRYCWTRRTAMLPSPTAAATRMTEWARTSPMAKTPGTLASSM